MTRPDTRSAHYRHLGDKANIWRNEASGWASWSRPGWRSQADAIPSRPRRARHLIEVARGHHLKREHDATLGMLTQAYGTAPETIRFNAYARQMLSDVLAGPPELRRQASELALQIGLTG